MAGIEVNNTLPRLQYFIAVVQVVRSE